MSYARTSLDELGDGIFRKVRQALDVTAFGVNAIVLPPDTEWFAHSHELQDELYFVHRGTAAFEIDGETFELGPGGLCHVEAKTVRRVGNAGDDELVLLIVGGSGGYVGRDGQLANPDDLDRRRRAGEGDVTAIQRPRAGD